MKYFGIRRECQFEVARCSCPRLRVDVVPNVSQHSGIFRESTVVNKTDKTREQGSAKIRRQARTRAVFLPSFIRFLASHKACSDAVLM